MIHRGISAFLDRIYAREEDPDDLYIRIKVGANARKSELIQSNIQIIADAESMLQALLGHCEGWVYEEGDKCFVELMKSRSTNPLERYAFWPSDLLDQEEEEGDDIVEESDCKVLTDALVTMALDCNERASVSQARFIQSVENYGDIFCELAHAQAEMAANKPDESPAWLQALSGIAPAFAPLVGDIHKKVVDKQEQKKAELEEKKEEETVTEDTDAPPIVASPEVPNPFDMRQ